MNNIYIHHHLGLGDHICLNGLVWDIANRNVDSKIHVFCKEKYYSNVRCLYDNTRIELIEIPSQEDEMVFTQRYFKTGGLIRIGFSEYYRYLRDNPDKNYTCDRVFYELMNVDYMKRFTGFKYERNYEIENEVFSELVNDEEYIFVHDDSARGYEIKIETEYKIVRNDIKYPIFHMIKVLENAKQIHCIENGCR